MATLSIPLRKQVPLSALLAALLTGCGGADKATDSSDPAATGSSTSTNTGTQTGSSTGTQTGGTTGGTTGTTTGTSNTSTPPTSTGGTTSATPCTVSIPATATVLDNGGLLNGAAAEWWACRNTVVSVTAPGHVVFLESADIVVNTTGTTIYAKSGTNIEVFDGPNTYILEDGAEDPGATAGTVTWCPVLTYDLSNAPTPGC